MFYDLNIPWSPTTTTHLPRTLAFLHDLGYNVIALNHTITGKLAPDLTCPILDPLPYQDSIPSTLTILRRCTLVLTENYQNARLAELSKNYDILAVRPVDEKSLQLACSSLDCDIISPNLTLRLPFWFKFKTLSEAVKSGKKFEITYASGISGDSNARRNLISNATQLIRASRGRGLIISSEATSAVACRGPWDVVNLAAVWGLGSERGFDGVSKECRGVVVTAKLKKTGYRGVVDVVYGGEKPAVESVGEKGKADKGKAVNGLKRKADVLESGESSATGGGGEKPPLSKRQMKKQAKEARLKAGAETQDTVAGAENGKESALDTSNVAK